MYVVNSFVKGCFRPKRTGYIIFFGLHKSETPVLLYLDLINDSIISFDYSSGYSRVCVWMGRGAAPHLTPKLKLCSFDSYG